MLSVLASGTLAAAPAERTSAKGSTYATALMRVPCDGEDALLCSLIAFNTGVVESLLALGKGDSLACTGRAKLSSWTAKDGTEAHGLGLVVERIMSAYQLEKKRTAAREPEAQAA